MDDFNAIRALNLQFEMQKAGSTHGTGSFFRVIFNFSARKIFPAALADAAFYSPTVGATCFLLSKSFSSFTFLSISEVIKRRITTNKHYYFFTILKKIVKNMQKIFTKIQTYAMLML